MLLASSWSFILRFALPAAFGETLVQVSAEVCGPCTATISISTSCCSPKVAVTRTGRDATLGSGEASSTVLRRGLVNDEHRAVSLVCDAFADAAKCADTVHTA